jgi:uracil-DNA glycosylase family 4
VRSLPQLEQRIVACQRCPRLRTHCTLVAQQKRAAYADWTYWGRPVPGFGDPSARLWIVGLAPGAHGANRTGRVFTGDRSGDFLYAALHRTGYANQPTSTHRDDGLALRDCWVGAAARCAPPDNKPTPIELRACSGYLDAEFDLLARNRVILALGKIAWDASVAMLKRKGVAVERAAFGHGAIAEAGGRTLVGSYHVSQQNTFTGRLTAAMFDQVLSVCRSRSEDPAPARRPPRRAPAADRPA